MQKHESLIMILRMPRINDYKDKKIILNLILLPLVFSITLSHKKSANSAELCT